VEHVEHVVEFQSGKARVSQPDHDGWSQTYFKKGLNW